jgi:hypothetical protein
MSVSSLFVILWRTEVLPVSLLSKSEMDARGLTPLLHFPFGISQRSFCIIQFPSINNHPTYPSRSSPLCVLASLRETSAHPDPNPGPAFVASVPFVVNPTRAQLPLRLSVFARNLRAPRSSSRPVFVPFESFVVTPTRANLLGPATA